MNFSPLRVLLALLLAGLLLAGCRPAPTPPPAPTQAGPDLDLDGSWAEVTDQGQGIGFIVAGKQITEFHLVYSMENCTEKAFNLAAIRGGGAWQDHTFTLKVPQELTISFMNAQTASGSFAFDPSQGLLAATCKPGPTTLLQFTANKLQR